MTDTPHTPQPDAKQRWAAGSALFYAVDHHNLPMAQAMVKAGADLNQLDSRGKTAMQHAVAHGDLDSWVRPAVSRNVARGFVNVRVDAELSVIELAPGEGRSSTSIWGDQTPFVVSGVIASVF